MAADPSGVPVDPDGVADAVTSGCVVVVVGDGFGTVVVVVDDATFGTAVVVGEALGGAVVVVVGDGAFGCVVVVVVVVGDGAFGAVVVVVVGVGAFGVVVVVVVVDAGAAVNLVSDAAAEAGTRGGRQDGRASPQAAVSVGPTALAKPAVAGSPDVRVMVTTATAAVTETRRTMVRRRNPACFASLFWTWCIAPPLREAGMNHQIALNSAIDSAARLTRRAPWFCVPSSQRVCPCRLRALLRNRTHRSDPMLLRRCQMRQGERQIDVSAETRSQHVDGFTLGEKSLVDRGGRDPAHTVLSLSHDARRISRRG
jgi:hypothetical protein